MAGIGIGIGIGLARSHPRVTQQGRSSALPYAGALALLIGASLLAAGCNSGSRSGSGADSSGASPAYVYAPITGIAYPAIPPLRVGTPIAPLVPATTGGFVVSYDVFPPLPAGLVLDNIGGGITGTPSQVASLTTHTITAENPASVVSTDLLIEVLPAAPIASFAATGSAMPEGGSVAIAVGLSYAPSAPLDLVFAIAGTATDGADFVAVASPLTIPPGSATASIAISGVDDAAVDAAETIVITLLPSVQAIVGANATHTVVVKDDDGPPAVAFGAPVAAVSEIGGTVTVGLVLLPAAAIPVEAVISAGGTSTLGADHLGIPPSVTFAPGETAHTFEVTLVDDDLFEGTETLSLSISSVIGSAVGAPAALVISVIDDELPPLVEFRRGGTAADETSGTVPVWIDLSALAGVDVSVSFALSGSATTPGDFVIPAPPLVIAAGTLSASLPVGILDDTLSESAESVVLDLTGALGADLGVIDRHTIWIQDIQQTPCLVSYSTTSLSLRAGEAMAPLTPLASCGAGTVWDASPAFPAGITLDPSTGIIAGTPTYPGTSGSHIVTAIGPMGISSVQLDIAVDPGFRYELSDETVAYDPADGLASVTLVVSLAEVVAPGALPHPIAGFSFGVGIDAAVLVADRISPGSDLAAINGGVGPDFFAHCLCPGGVTLGVVLSFLGLVTLEAGTTLELAELSLSAAPGSLVGNLTGTTVAVAFDDGIGAVPVANIVAVEGHSHEPTLVPGSVSFVP